MKIPALCIDNKKSYADFLKTSQNLAEIQFLSIDNAHEFPIDFTPFTGAEEIWLVSKAPYNIHPSLGTLPKLKKLIVNNGILPGTMHRLTGLQELWLKDETLLHLPDHTNQINTESLHIMYGLAKDPIPCPDAVFNIRGVTSLRIAASPFSEIPDAINHFSRLKHLNFDCCLSDLSHFPNLSGLTHLKELRVRGEAVQGQKKPPYALLAEVLEAIKTLSQLEVLDLSFWKPRKKADYLTIYDKKGSLPDVFDNFPNLKELILCDMKLQTLPPSIRSLNQLTKLNIRDNSIAQDEMVALKTKLPYTAIA